MDWNNGQPTLKTEQTQTNQTNKEKEKIQIHIHPGPWTEEPREGPTSLTQPNPGF